LKLFLSCFSGNHFFVIFKEKNFQGFFCEDIFETNIMLADRLQRELASSCSNFDLFSLPSQKKFFWFVVETSSFLESYLV